MGACRAVLRYEPINETKIKTSNGNSIREKMKNGLLK